MEEDEAGRKLWFCPCQLAECPLGSCQDRDGFTAVHWAAMEDEALTMPGGPNCQSTACFGSALRKESNAQSGSDPNCFLACSASGLNSIYSNQLASTEIHLCGDFFLKKSGDQHPKVCGEQSPAGNLPPFHPRPLSAAWHSGRPCWTWASMRMPRTSRRLRSGGCGAYSA